MTENTILKATRLVLASMLFAGGAVATLAAPAGVDAIALQMNSKLEASSPTLSPPDPILGDANQDCIVDVRDLTAVLGTFGSSSQHTDFDQDGVVGDDDVTIVNAVWGSTCGTRLLGDINGDGRVDTTDLTRLLSAWGSSDARTDLTGDGFTDDTDLQLLQANWGRTLGRRLLGDHTGNDVVDVADLTWVLGNWDLIDGQLELDIVLAQWGATSGRDLLADVNGDKLVSATDQDLVLAFWGSARAQADVDGNGTVDTGDLTTVLAAFGQTAGRDLAGDINGDWRVDAVDQAALLAAWGSSWSQADLDNDGTVGAQDLTILLGAYENTFGVEFTGDVNGDCSVGDIDREIVTAVWGTEFRQADVDGDGTVGVQDLTLVLANYGNECP